ncbi:glycosyltransferase family A protein [Streptomyces sp. NPDC002164]|uniref:glycosyltransferase family A protein n=1 Tax=Streptomyces sp. NPDC002164 TaxID=3364633 RepID=UPI0036A2861F
MTIVVEEVVKRDRRSAIGIVIPARNESGFVIRTLQTLAAQDVWDRCEVVVVENGSDDDTASQVAEFAAQSCLHVTLLRLDPASAVAARIHGMDYLMGRAEPPAMLVSADADTTYPAGWLSALEDAVAAGADVVASAGYMDPVLWSWCPTLTSRYVERIGTIFFDPDTTKSLGVDESTCLFTPQVYEDFGRPVCAPGFGITAACYRRLGGFRREHYDAGATREILIAGLPLMFRAELNAFRVAYVRAPWWQTSPRRLVSEPEIQLGRTLQDTDMFPYREVAPEAYIKFDQAADDINYQDLLLNCVRDYLLTPCLTRPQLLRRNAAYFGKLAGELNQTINRWHGERFLPEPRHLFDLATDLTETHGSRVLETFAEFRGRRREQPASLLHN